MTPSSRRAEAVSNPDSQGGIPLCKNEHRERSERPSYRVTLKTVKSDEKQAFSGPKWPKQAQNRDFEAIFSHFYPQNVNNDLSNHFQKKEMSKTLNYRTGPVSVTFAPNASKLALLTTSRRRKYSKH